MLRRPNGGEIHAGLFILCSRKQPYLGLNILGIGIKIQILVKKQHTGLLPNELVMLLCRDLGAG